MKKICYLLLLIVLISQTGCGPTVSNVLKKYENEFNEKRDQFRSIANLLPPKGSIKSSSLCKDIVPAMVFNEKNKKYNTEIIMFDQLSDPDTKPEIDLFLSNDLLLAIQWTGAKNPLSPSILVDNGADMDRTLKAALDYRYLVINRVAKLTQPEVKSGKNYSRGQIVIETIIVNLVNNKPLCSFASSANSPSDLSSIPISTTTSYAKKGKVRFRTEYVVNQAEPVEVQLERAAYSIMWEEARVNVMASLQKLTNGDIELKE